MGSRLYLVLSIGLGLLLLAGCGAQRSVSDDDIRPGSKAHQVQAFTNLGRVLLSQGELASALVQLSRAEAMDPQNADVLTLLGMTYYSRQDYQTALNYLQRALSVDPSKTEIHNNIGLVYLELKQFDQAKQEFDICLKEPTYPNPHLPLLNLGQLAEVQGDLARAEDYYRRIISINPQYSVSYFRMARIFDQRSDVKQATDYLLNAIRLNPNYVDALYLLGQVYEKRSMKDESAEAYGRVVVLVPNTPLAMDAQRRARRVLGFEQ
ncbi:MAG: tetratricopeptide repeat protein [Deltaproteobacteria bacterium]|jgi:type IV pilus biogenesis/stability protein PilW|nr:tetratricopeptide repeat protein [Deltaproteobacteria bacterium]